jgi:hypothetical protein
MLQKRIMTLQKWLSVNIAVSLYLKAAGTGPENFARKTAAVYGGKRMKRLHLPYILSHNADTAAMSLKAAVKKRTSTVATVVISKIVLEVILLSTAQFKSEKDYRVALIIAKSMLKSRIIDERDYRKINTILINKYRPLLGSLCC